MLLSQAALITIFHIFPSSKPAYIFPQTLPLHSNNFISEVAHHPFDEMPHSALTTHLFHHRFNKNVCYVSLLVYPIPTQFNLLRRMSPNICTPTSLLTRKGSEIRPKESNWRKETVSNGGGPVGSMNSGTVVVVSGSQKWCTTV